MTLTKIISGGQTGADMGALVAAKAAGLETGGYMPKHYRNHNGVNFQMADEFGMTEHSSSGYRERTWDNVKISDATLRIAHRFDSAGERCTMNAIRHHNKKHIDVELEFHDNYNDVTVNMTAAVVAQRLKAWGVQVLNVAGNSERTCPGIEKIVTHYVGLVIKFMNEDEVHESN